MHLRSFSLCFTLAALCVATSAGQEYHVETIEGAPESDELAPAIVERLSDSGVRVVRGESSARLELWLCRTAPLVAEPAGDVMFPLESGGLVGVVRFVRRGYDFRDQQIDRGWYTLRYALQPVDGNHVGTSPTRDFLLASRAADDVDPGVVDADELIVRGQDAAQTTHPALLSLQLPVEGAESPSLRHVEENEWLLLNLTARGETAGAEKTVTFDLVVEGHAAE